MKRVFYTNVTRRRLFEDLARDEAPTGMLCNNEQRKYCEDDANNGLFRLCPGCHRIVIDITAPRK